MRSWYAFVARLCRAYYSRVTVLRPERVPVAGPVLFVGTHRNGAVDGWLYAKLAPRAEFMIASQLRRTLFARLFFAGIEVVRDKDAGDRARNASALDDCLARLAAGGHVFVLPEGTSDLGPGLLPLKAGAARIAAACAERGIPLTVVPVALHYERAWAFRSRAEIRVGTPFGVAELAGAPTGERVAHAQARIAAALADVAAQFESPERQAEAERLAYVATLGTRIDYSDALKHFEKGVRPNLRAAGDALLHDAWRRGLLHHQGVPLVPTGPSAVYVLALLLIAPVVALGALVNAPPLLAGVWAGRRFPDARNVVTLWRILVGLPALAAWATAIAVACLARGAPLLLASYVVASLAALRAWYRVKKLAVAAANSIAGADLAPRLAAFRALVVEELTRGR